MEGAVKVTMLARHDALFELKFEHEEPVLDILEEYGHMPLPPYIDRPDESSDKERYQTVYNREPEPSPRQQRGCISTTIFWKS